MAARRILFVEAGTAGGVGGSLPGILHLIPRLDRARFEPVLALYEAKHVAANGLPVHVLPPLPRPTPAQGEGPLGRILLRAANLYGVVGTPPRTLAPLFPRQRPALGYLANRFRAH